MSAADSTTIFGKPITVQMLEHAINKSVAFEQTLGEVAQEINEALGIFDFSGTKQDAIAVIEAARRAVAMIEKANPNWPLYEQPKTDENIVWESHLLWGTWPESNSVDEVHNES